MLPVIFIAVLPSAAAMTAADGPGNCAQPAEPAAW